MDHELVPGVDFFLARGGAFYRLLGATRLLPLAGRGAWRSPVALAALGWLPLFVASAAHLAVTGHPDPILRDPVVHVRLLVAIPLFVVAEVILDRRCHFAVEWFVSGRFAGPDTRDAVAPIIGRAERLRDGWVVELGLLAAAFVGGIATLHAGGATGLIRDASVLREVTAARVWYALVSLPLFQFLLFRWLWRWGIWSVVLLGFARLEVRPVSTHPDHAGGLQALSAPIPGFAVFLFGAASVVSAFWATRILRAGASLASFYPSLAIAGAVALLIAFAPLLAFVGHLARARFDDAGRYGKLALRYSRLFDRRWVAKEDDTDLLGSPDISGLADLLASVGDMGRMRVVPFGLRSVIMVLVGFLVPMMPLVLTQVPLAELLRKLAGALIGGLPG